MHCILIVFLTNLELCNKWMQKYFHKVPSFSLHIRFHFQARALISGSFLSKSNECIVNGGGKRQNSCKRTRNKKKTRKRKKETHLLLKFIQLCSKLPLYIWNILKELIKHNVVWKMLEHKNESNIKKWNTLLLFFFFLSFYFNLQFHLFFIHFKLFYVYTNLVF